MVIRHEQGTAGKGSIVWLAVVVAIAVGAGIAVDLTRGLQTLELASVNLRFAVRGRQPRPRGIAVVAIDAATFDARASGGLGLQWPFPRSVHGRLIDRLAADHARAIVYDIQFTEPTTPRQDNALIESVRHAGDVVLATTETAAGGSANVFGGATAVRYARARVGNASFIPSAGGALRRVPYRIGGLDSLAVVAAERATGRRVTPAQLGASSPLIDFRGPPGTIATYSFASVLRGRVPAAAFRDRIVVVGPSAPSLQDVHPTPTGLMSGAEIQANAIDTILRGAPLRSSGWLVGVLVITALGLLITLSSLRLSLTGMVGLMIALGGAYAVATQVAFDDGRVLAFVAPEVTLTLGFVGSLAVRYLVEAFERRRVSDLFGRFVSDSVAAQVLAQRGAEGMRLRGVRLESTVLFSDLRGFTSFAEQLDPELVVGILNRYLSAMSDAILDHDGTLVAYMGDGIMAVFGAPVAAPDHADRALAAAREMLQRLEAFNASLRADGLGDGFRMGIGLNSGPVMSGTVGSERRMEYTAIGDTTNTAARLEGMTKGTSHQLFLSEATRDAFVDPPRDLVFVQEMEVRGRRERLRVWGIEPAASG